MMNDAEKIRMALQVQLQSFVLMPRCPFGSSGGRRRSRPRRESALSRQRQWAGLRETTDRDHVTFVTFEKQVTNERPPFSPHTHILAENPETGRSPHAFA